MRRGVVDGKKPIELKSSFLFGTHHKTGTIWMGTLLGNFCRDTYRKMSTVSLRTVAFDDISTFRPTVVFDYFSMFYDPFNFVDNMKGVSIIRHPKDQIISATRYHQNAPEPWLHYKRDDFGGMTYSEKINSLDTWEEKVYFEMTHASQKFARHMVDHKNNLLNIKYEDLVNDYPYPKALDTIFSHLDFDEEDREVFHKYYLDTHINNKNNMHHVSQAHIAHGEPEQWLELWPESCNKYYEENILYIEKELGY